MRRRDRVFDRARFSFVSAALALTLSPHSSFAQPQVLQVASGNAVLPADSVETSQRPRTDSAEVSHRAHDLQARFERRRRQMLPKFYVGTADHCLIVGRFCEWHPNLSDYVVPDEGKNIARARAELLRDLEKASSEVPGDD